MYAGVCVRLLDGVDGMGWEMVGVRRGKRVRSYLHDGHFEKWDGFGFEGSQCAGVSSVVWCKSRSVADSCWGTVNFASCQKGIS